MRTGLGINGMGQTEGPFAAVHETHIDAEGSRDALLARWTDSFAQVERFRTGVLDDAVQSDIERLTHLFLAGRTALFDDRITEGGYSTATVT